MRPIILQGRSAISDFRIAALKKALNAAVPGIDIVSIDAAEVYFIEADSPLGDTARKRSLALLAAKGPFERADGFFVTPRKGTISPWSSKATDIFHNCDIKEVLRVERGIHYRISGKDDAFIRAEDLGPGVFALHDRMTEAVYDDVSDFFRHFEPAPLRTVPLMAEGPEAFRKANIEWGLALNEEEIDYLVAAYQEIGRDPTDAELVMFSQVNSEHCRHKIFNAGWIVDGEESERSLFGMIRNTHAQHPEGTLVAYSDNSGVLEGHPGDWWEIDQKGPLKSYRRTATTLDILCKVETHNHPTAISPFPGAATGVGGEIRDEGATGRGARSKAGLSALMVSNLRLPDYLLPWEKEIADHPARMASPFDIMVEGPLGGAGFGNEFGRPQLCGLFRTLDIVHNGIYRGYHKPIMAAGGMGNLKREHVEKKEIPQSALIIQLGGPAMKIGLGGGAASSIAAGSQSEELDFDSVQRGNAEMERRCQEVIDACISLGEENPILSIHDVGAGGLSNAVPELVEKTGGRFHLRKINNEDTSMSPMEIWCNEAQERYVLALLPERLAEFEALCARERCPFAILGETTGDRRLLIEDSHFVNNPIDMDLGLLLGKPPKMLREVTRVRTAHPPLDVSGIELQDAIDRVLRFPAVANKSFLITIGDRTVTGLIARDQMVGPWQTPVADVAVTASTMGSTTGEAMAMGERTPIAILDAPASGRIAIGECLTNIAASAVGRIGNVKLSANWMAAAGEPGEDAALFDTVKAVGMELCPALGISIPVGKDSLSMRTSWQDSDGKAHKQVAPLSLLVSGFSPVSDVCLTLTPDLKSAGSALLLIDLGAGRNRLGGSALAQVYNQIGDVPPDLDAPAKFVAFFTAVQELLSEGLILSYHDRSDGGLLATLAEMAFAGRKGLSIVLDKLVPEGSSLQDKRAILAALFAEELGAVLEIDRSQLAAVTSILAKHGIADISHLVGSTTEAQVIEISLQNESVYRESLTTLNRAWSELSFRMQSLRDNPVCAREEFDLLLDESNRGLQVKPSYDPDAGFSVNTGARPRIAIMREQGINGQSEMAFAFDRAGFAPVDVHMTDLLGGLVDLKEFAGLVACGGFSYGDVLGAGSGWAKSILYNPSLAEMFQAFFSRPDSFSLGVCNGCQMISQLKELIPGADHWPTFIRNRSEQFEGRIVNVEVLPSSSIFLKGMEGSILPVAVAHGEGRTDFSATGDGEKCVSGGLVSLRYVDNDGRPTEMYPLNPNGSADGATAFTTADGRTLIMMPHPERGFRSVQMSYRPKGVFAGENGPWMRLFQNARTWVG